jgi:hypothetical protein
MSDGYDTLKAAQDAAYWAGTSALAAWLIGALTLALNGVAAFFLWHQLRASRQALSAATEAANAATAGIRPWIQLFIADTGKLSVQHGICLFGCDVSFKNVGKTPAPDCQLHIVAVQPESPEATSSDDLLAAYNKTMEEGSFIGTTLFPDESKSASGPYKLEVLAHSRQPSLIMLVFNVTYRVPGEKRWHSTPTIRILSWTGQGNILKTDGYYDVQLLPFGDWGLEPT